MIPLAIIAQLAATVGPDIVKWVAGDDAGKVAKEVADIATGVTGKATPEDALAAIQADPALALQFRERVLEHSERLEAMYLADRSDARARDVAIRASGQRNKRADLMVFTAFATLCLILWLVWSSRSEMPAELLGFFSTAMGVLLKMLSDAFAFEFGSSRGSKDKDAMMLRGRGDG